MSTNFYILSAIINGVSSTILGLFVFLKNKRARINQVFALFCLSVAFWSYAYYFWPSAPDKATTLFWFQMLHIGAIFVPVTYLHFVVIWLNLNGKKKKIIKFGYLISIVIAVFIPTSFFIKDMSPKLSFRYWGEPGFLYHIFLAIFLSYAAYAVVLLYRAYHKSRGIQRAQIKYILIGTIIGYLGGSTNYPLWYNIPMYPVGTILVSVYIMTVVYAITRYRLMDIRIAFRKSIAYVFAAAFAYGSFYFVVWLLNTLFGSIYARSAFIFAVLVAIIFVVLFFLFSDFIKRLTNKYLFGRLYSQHEAIKKFSQELTTIIDLGKLIDAVADVIKKSLGVDKFAVFLVSREGECRIYKNINFNQRRINSLACSRDLINRLKQRGTEPLIMEELNAGTGIILPLVMKSKLRGIIVLGERASNEVYSKEDIELLETLSNQVSIALENARLYDQVQDLTENLQEKVDEQVNKIKDLLKTREELLTMKEDFLTTVSHQLRTPVSIFYGLLDEWAMATDKRKKKIGKNIVLSAERLKNTVNDMLDAMEIERGMKFNFKEVDLTAILNEIVSTLKPNYDKKKLSLKLNIPKSLNISASEQFLKQALTNLIDNAERYTKEGGTEITVSQEERNVKIIIKDTGIGLTKEDKEKIFKTQFFRGDRSRDVSPDGSGLGLYIAKRIIDKHKGTIEVESEGINKGSAFIINLPI